jgi:hypothetical protein
MRHPRIIMAGIGVAVVAVAGVGGKLTVVGDVNGNQVAYNGHLLYTFASDNPGQVTGQGVQDFFVATPGLAQISSSTAPSGSAPAAPSAGFGYRQRARRAGDQRRQR